ncbi:hypothetical protein HAX54_013904 [Datura stramonium]|uniref:Uncharacterized protein n=1 Tax=Datura stramonium TaxID=4076 RepID=A0ABS8TP57_DATST|nr:hypothetical protein [Datura stramonium]
MFGASVSTHPVEWLDFSVFFLLALKSGDSSVWGHPALVTGRERAYSGKSRPVKLFVMFQVSKGTGPVGKLATKIRSEEGHRNNDKGDISGGAKAHAERISMGKDVVRSQRYDTLRDTRSIHMKLLKRSSVIYPNYINISLPYQRAQLAHGSIPFAATGLDLEIVVKVVRARSNLINGRLPMGLILLFPP